MIKNFKTLLMVPLFGLMFAGNASANVIENYTMLVGINGYINVSEGLFNTDFEDIGVQYKLDILDPESPIAITSFAVSTNSTANTVESTRGDWMGEQLSAAEWDGSIYSLLGSFSSFFGGDRYVNIYNIGEIGPSIVAGTDGMFQFQAYNSFGDSIALASDFVAINANNGIVDQSRAPNDVPEPGPLALLGFGLIVIGLMGRRRKA